MLNAIYTYRNVSRKLRKRLDKWKMPLDSLQLLLDSCESVSTTENYCSTIAEAARQLETAARKLRKQIDSWKLHLESWKTLLDKRQQKNRYMQQSSDK